MLTKSDLSACCEFGSAQSIFRAPKPDSYLVRSFDAAHDARVPGANTGAPAITADTGLNLG